MPTGDPDHREVVSGRDVSLVRTVGGLLLKAVVVGRIGVPKPRKHFGTRQKSDCTAR